MNWTDHASIIIDEADVMMGFNGWEELIRDLADGSWDDKMFNVMLCCSNHDNVKKIIELNGRTKITLIGRTPQFSRCVTLAGSPEIVKSILSYGCANLSDAAHDETAAWWDKMWTRGPDIISRLDLLD